MLYDNVSLASDDEHAHFNKFLEEFVHPHVSALRKEKEPDAAGHNHMSITLEFSQESNNKSRTKGMIHANYLNQLERGMYFDDIRYTSLFRDYYGGSVWDE